MESHGKPNPLERTGRPPLAAWAEDALPDESRQQLLHLEELWRDSVRTRAEQPERGRATGVGARFTGAGSPAKVVAALALSARLGAGLLAVNVPAVVHTYIGETEKNLNQLFDAASIAGAVLFFDEADALFGSRTDVKDGHARYQNGDVGLLLQRLENHTGLIILATNVAQTDEVTLFARTLVEVRFPAP